MIIGVVAYSLEKPRIIRANLTDDERYYGGTLNQAAAEFE